MAAKPSPHWGLSGTQLKILALICMTADHVGLQLFPGVPLLRLVGRLAFPIYGWMIAEGCRYTRSRSRYFLRLAGLATVCQAAYFFAMGSLYQCVLVTFSLSLVLIWATDRVKKRPSAGNILLLSLLLGAAWLLTVTIPGQTTTDFALDYGFWGVLLPVAVYLGRTKWERLALCAADLTLLAMSLGGIQWWGLLALLPLALYSGQKGKGKLGTLFYLYYPAHLLVIYGISLLL